MPIEDCSPWMLGFQKRGSRLQQYKIRFSHCLMEAHDDIIRIAIAVSFFDVKVLSPVLQILELPQYLLRTPTPWWFHTGYLTHFSCYLWKLGW